VERSVIGREAFQEIDVARVFGPLAKWTVEVDSAERIPEIIHKAFRIATSGRCGPVVISLPEDVLSEVVEVRDVPRSDATQAAPEKSDIDRVRSALASAQRPILIVGGSGWTQAAMADLVAFAEKQQLPVVSSFRRQDIMANRHPNYAGHLSLATSRALAARIRNADLILALGARLSDVTTGGYGLVTAPYPLQRLIHIHPDPNELGRVYRADVAIASSMPNMGAMLAAMKPIGDAAWGNWLLEMRAEYVSTTDPKGVKSQGAVDLGAVVAHVDTRLPAGSIVTNGAGNYTVWLHRFFRYHAGATQLAPTSGAMGYGLPAAVAAKLRHPDRAVVCFAGDGCFLMYPQEIATAVQHGAAIVIVVVNNSIYGTIRMHQERRFPGRVHGTDMVNPDFVALATSFGAHAEVVETTAAFAPAFERALAAGRPALIDVRVDPQQLTPDFRLPSPAVS
jgi:acetolactate synthase-1/2/3 large subunit